MNIFNRLLIKYSLRPYKTTKLPTGVSVIPLQKWKNNRKQKLMITKTESRQERTQERISKTTNRAKAWKRRRTTK